MTASNRDSAQKAVARIYREESRRVFATLVRLVGDFDLAEEALQEAFAAAVAQWGESGVPANPRAWLVSTGRFKAIDAIRRRARFDARAEELAARMQASAQPAVDDEVIEDDRLRLIFICCHPVLPAEARVAMTLREVCGLTTEEIARAFLMTPPTLAQRIVRAKAKIRAAKIPFEAPSPEELPERLDAVLHVVYLVFNEGYYASAGEGVTRADLSGEAIRLGRLLAELLPAPQVLGLLALMLFQESRRAARMTADGDLVLLEDQDRALWDSALIKEGAELITRVQALRPGWPHPYIVQAAIAAEHALSPTSDATNWDRIVSHYDALMAVAPSAVVELNRAVAVAMRDGPEAGLAIVDEILARGELANYQHAHAARADFCRRLGRVDEARAAYEAALGLAAQGPERRFLERRLRELG